MKVKYFDIQTKRYPISCKLYSPERHVRGIVLGVHGFAGDKESSALSALATSCADKSVALICFDFPAHGSSTVHENELTVANCMNDLYAVADWCRRKYPDAKRYMFATSFGGYIALLCSQRLTDFNMILRVPAVTMPEHILTDLLHISPEDYKERGSITCGFERKIDLPFSFYQELQEHRISECVCDQPMLIIHGDKDDIVPFEDVVSFCAAHKNAVLKTIKGADHRFKKSGEIEKVVEAALAYWNL